MLLERRGYWGCLVADGVFAGLCPACGGDLTFAEVESSTCKSTGGRLCSFGFDDEFERVLGFFEAAVGASPRVFQKLWGYVSLRRELAAVAPTGMGKTSFSTVMALFLGEERLQIIPYSFRRRSL